MRNILHLYIVLIQTTICSAAGLQKVVALQSVNISCPAFSLIQIENITVLEDDLQNEQCNLNDNDEMIIKENCNNYSDCNLQFNLTSKCLQEYGNLNLTYTCKGVSDLVCDFEINKCVFELTINSPTVQSNRGQQSTNRPYNDHTTNTKSGYYIYIIPRRNSSWGGFGSLKSSGTISGRCLSLWYFVYGSNVYYFIMKLKFQSGSVLNSSLNITSRNNWIEHVLELNNISTFEIILEVSFGSGRPSVAIDDIYLSNSSCTGVGMFSYERLNINNPFKIQECIPLHLENGSILLSLDSRFPTTNCLLVKHKVEQEMFDFCISETFYDQLCVFTPSKFLHIANECFVVRKNKTLLIGYTCIGGDTSKELLTNSMTNGKGIIVGVVCGVGFIVGMVIVLWYLRRRSKATKQKTKCQGQDVGFNDLIGNQTVVSQVDHKSNSNNYEYADSDAGRNQSEYSKPDKSMILLKHKNEKHHVHSNGMDYAVSLSNSEDGMDKYLKAGAASIGDYAILDPNETGFNRSQCNETRQPEYELAGSINHDEHKTYLQDPYAVTANGTYDSFNNRRHKYTDTNLYSHTVDSVYDTPSLDVNGRQTDDSEDTYNHFFGEKTEDDYDVTKRE